MPIKAICTSEQGENLGIVERSLRFAFKRWESEP